MTVPAVLQHTNIQLSPVLCTSDVDIEPDLNITPG